MFDQYTACPCGSGKKFKWCCQAIYPGIQQAMEQMEAGQQDSALRVIDDVIKAHPNNPEAWGQKARMLFAQGKPDEAEELLEKAFAINPKYPNGLLLRASMRYQEGEVQGALLLARRAADAFDPEAKETYTTVHLMIFDIEIRHNRPIAARAALEQVIASSSTDNDYRNTMKNVFGDDSSFPLAARKKYELLKAAPSRRAAWDGVLKNVPPRLSALVAAYDQLTQQAADDANAWYNLGLARAWLGDNKGAIGALDTFIEKTTDEQAAADAGTLCEVLRTGIGMEEESDYYQKVITYQIRDPQPINALLQEWVQSHRLIPLPNEQEGMITALILELTTAGLVTVGAPAAQSGRMAGYLVIAGGLIRIHCPVAEIFPRLKEEFRTKLGLGLTDLRVSSIPVNFSDVLAEAQWFPVGPFNEEQAQQKAIEHAGRFFEDTWIHRPLKSLSNIAPIDAVGSSKLRRKVRGLVEFFKQCVSSGLLREYDFSRVLRKLGIGEVEATTSVQAAATADLSAMGAAELAALKPESLSDEQLEQAYQTAYRLDAKEIAAHFAAALVARPVQPGKTDRYPFFSFLVSKALADGKSDAALEHINQGEHLDAESNEGKRREDYETRRAAVHVGRGDAAEAEIVFDRLIQRLPRNFKIRGAAAESMLRLKQPKKALKFAEEGLKEARLANDRDAEGYLNDLAAAARRQGA